jgi:K+ transporter
MNFFKTRTSWTNAEFIILKLCIASAYVFLGSYFHKFIELGYLPILLLFAISCIWAVYLWVKKMKHQD